MNKPFHEMTDDALLQEWRHWNEKIRNASGWGASLAAAAEFRADIARALARRGLPAPPEPEDGR